MNAPPPDQPSSPPEDSPDRMVAPRYLAGFDGDVGTDPLSEAGWRAFTDERGFIRHHAPDHSRCLVLLPPDFATPFGGLHRMWHFWGRNGAAGAPAWNAAFTSTCPPEIIAAFAEQLADPPPLADGKWGDGLEPLADAGWDRRDVGRLVTYYAPAGQVVVRFAPAPFHAADHELPDIVARRVGAQLGPHRPALWLAKFSATTPAYLVNAFCTALADPEPLPRYEADIDDTVRPYLHLT